MGDCDYLKWRHDLFEGNWYTRDVFLDGRWLDPDESLAVAKRSPSGFAWGYGGSGPAQLALGILLRVTGRETAVAHYQAFKRDVIARLPDANFCLPLEVVRAWLTSHVGADTRWHVRRCTQTDSPTRRRDLGIAKLESEFAMHAHLLIGATFEQDARQPNLVYVEQKDVSRTAYWCPLGGGEVRRDGPYGLRCVMRSPEGFEWVIVKDESELLAVVEGWHRRDWFWRATSERP